MKFLVFIFILSLWIVLSAQEQCTIGPGGASVLGTECLANGATCSLSLVGFNCTTTNTFCCNVPAGPGQQVVPCATLAIPLLPLGQCLSVTSSACLISSGLGSCGPLQYCCVSTT